MSFTEFHISHYKPELNEDVQSSITDADLLTKAAELEAKKVDAKKKVDDATKQYNDICQQIDTQMVQLINTQAQRNAQTAKSSSSSNSPSNNINASQENESSLNEDNEGQFKVQRVLLDTFLPKILGLSYNDKLIEKTLNKAGLRCYNDDNDGLVVFLKEPRDLGILFQVFEDNYLDENEYEEPVLSQLPGEFTRAFYSGE